MRPSKRSSEFPKTSPLLSILLSTLSSCIGESNSLVLIESAKQGSPKPTLEIVSSPNLPTLPNTVFSSPIVIRAKQASGGPFANSKIVLSETSTTNSFIFPSEVKTDSDGIANAFVQAGPLFGAEIKIHAVLEGNQAAADTTLLTSQGPGHFKLSARVGETPAVGVPFHLDLQVYDGTTPALGETPSKLFSGRFHVTIRSNPATVATTIPNSENHDRFIVPSLSTGLWTDVSVLTAVVDQILTFNEGVMVDDVQFEEAGPNPLHFLAKIAASGPFPELITESSLITPGLSGSLHHLGLRYLNGPNWSNVCYLESIYTYNGLFTVFPEPTLNPFRPSGSQVAPNPTPDSTQKRAGLLCSTANNTFNQNLRQFIAGQSLTIRAFQADSADLPLTQNDVGPPAPIAVNWQSTGTWKNAVTLGGQAGEIQFRPTQAGLGMLFVSSPTLNLATSIEGLTLPAAAHHLILRDGPSALDRSSCPFNQLQNTGPGVFNSIDNCLVQSLSAGAKTYYLGVEDAFGNWIVNSSTLGTLDNTSGNWTIVSGLNGAEATIALDNKSIRISPSGSGAWVIRVSKTFVDTSQLTVNFHGITVP